MLILNFFTPAPLPGLAHPSWVVNVNNQKVGGTIGPFAFARTFRINIHSHHSERGLQRLQSTKTAGG